VFVNELQRQQPSVPVSTKRMR